MFILQSICTNIYIPTVLFYTLFLFTHLDLSYRPCLKMSSFTNENHLFCKQHEIQKKCTFILKKRQKQNWYSTSSPSELEWIRFLIIVIVCWLYLHLIVEQSSPNNLFWNTPHLFTIWAVNVCFPTIDSILK